MYLRKFRIISLSMDRLELLSLFVDIVEKGGLSAAGRGRGLSPATVSERLMALERQYGVRLLNRTTRSVSPTDAGRQLLDGARHLLAESEALEHRVRDGVDRLSGLIRLSAPSDLGQARIMPVIDQLIAQHPDIQVDLQLTDGRVDVTALGLDLAIRTGDLADSTLKVRKLGSRRRLVCAAPAYLEQHGVPHDPSELAKHNCLLMRFGSELDNAWPFVIDGRLTRVMVRGNRIINDGREVRRWCVAGYGLAFKSEWDVTDDLAKGRLVSCLAEFEPPPASVQIVYSPSANLPGRVRYLIDALIETFS